jgi:hypothetical protein
MAMVAGTGNGSVWIEPGRSGTARTLDPGSASILLTALTNR